MMTAFAGERATNTRETSVHVSLLCLLHHLWIILHAQPLHRRHHRKLQHAEKEGIELTHRITLLAEEQVGIQPVKIGAVASAETFGRPSRTQLLSQVVDPLNKLVKTAGVLLSVVTFVITVLNDFFSIF